VIEDFLSQVIGWASGRSDIRGVALVGSHARGTGRPDSDVDLVILATEPEQFVNDTAWTRRFGTVSEETKENWGRVTSIRVWFEGGLEVEFGFTSPEWAAAPMDEGTRQVVASGIRVLLDPDGVLGALRDGLGSCCCALRT
jgi:hypothetical protein